MLSTWRLLRSLPRPVQILIAGTFVNKAGTYIVPYLTIARGRYISVFQSSWTFAKATPPVTEASVEYRVEA